VTTESLVVALIPARGGSKGVPRKNIRPLAGKPLIAYSIEAARASRLIARVVVSTDDAEMRPAELARDDSPEWLTWRHAVLSLAAEGGRPVDAFVCVSPTSPLRAVEDIDACVRALLASDADMVMTVRPSERNPYFNMVVLDAEGYARLVIRPDRPTYRRQDAPPVYDITTVAYAFRPEFVLRSASELEGRVKAVVVPAERAVDIDTELDFSFAEFLLTRSPSAR
jgi:N-acylneuraminate cytidylyltransferase